MPNLTTTVVTLLSYSPCQDGLKKALTGINWKPGQDKETKISIKDVLESNGIADTVWFLRCFEYKEYCKICADIAESVLPIYENKYKNDDRPRKAIEAIRLYKKGDIGKKELKAAAYAAYAAAYAAADAYAAAYAYAAYAAYAAADAAADADAYADAYAAYAAAAAAAAADADADAYAYAYARKAQWGKIEQILIKFIEA